MLVSEIPGTTRDAVDTPSRASAGAATSSSTPRASAVAAACTRAAETLSVMRARRRIERADVVVLVLDGSEPFAAQDTHIAGYALEAHAADRRRGQQVGSRRGARGARPRPGGGVRERLQFVKEVPIVLVSAKTGQRVPKILGSRGRGARGGGASRADARAQPLAAGGGAGASGRSRRRATASGCSTPRRPASHPPRFVAVLQRRAAGPLLAAPPPREQPARALRLRRGTAPPARSAAGASRSGAERDRGQAARAAPPVWRALQNFSDDDCANHAAAVAYFSLLSCAPLRLSHRTPARRQLLADADRRAVAPRSRRSSRREIAPFVDDLAKSLHQGRSLVAVALPGAGLGREPRLLGARDRGQRRLRHDAAATVLAVAAEGVRRRRRRGRLLAGGAVAADHVAALVDRATRHSLGSPPLARPLGAPVASPSAWASTFAAVVHPVLQVAPARTRALARRGTVGGGRRSSCGRPRARSSARMLLRLARPSGSSRARSPASSPSCCGSTWRSP